MITVTTLDRRHRGYGIFKYRVYLSDQAFRACERSGEPWYVDKARASIELFEHLTAVYGTGLPLEFVSTWCRDNNNDFPAWCYFPEKNGYQFYFRDEAVLEEFKKLQAWRVLKA